MLRATWRSLLARKLRLILSGIAVILGVAFVSGAFVLTDSMRQVFDELFADVNKNTAVSVQGTSALGGGDADREPVPQAVLDRVARVDGVAEAQGVAFGYAQVVDKKGKAYKTGGAPSFGFSFDPESRQESLRLKRGHAPHGPNEVAIDSTTASRAHLAVGDRFKVLLKGPARQVTLVGIVTLDKAPSFAGASLIAFDPASAQRALGTPGTWSLVGIAAETGVSSEELERRVEAVLPEGFEALTQQQKIKDDSKDIQQGLSFFNTLLLVFAGVALFVGMFLIFNTFSMLIAQRTRELALMRALGASRSQVLRSMLLESAVVGVISSLTGFALGILVAIAIRSLLAAIGIELPSGRTVVALHTFVYSMVTGVVVTIVAAVIPARRAARVSPVQAMRESGPAEDRSLRWRATIGAVVLAGGVAALVAGLRTESGNGLKVVGLGAALTFLGVAVLSPLVARPVLGVIGWPFTRLGAASTLGRGNALRSPRRTSATAAALMIGLALVAMISTLAASVKASLADYVAESLGADFVLHTENFEPFSPELAKQLRDKPEFDQVASYRFGKAKVNGTTVEVQGVDSGPLVATLKVKALSGDLTTLDSGTLAISENTAADRGLSVGDTVQFVWSRTGTTTMRVGAVFATNIFAGDYLVGSKVYDSNVTEKLDGVVAVILKEGVTPKQGRAAVESVAKAFPNVDVEDQSQLVATQREGLDFVLNVITGLLFFSVLIAVLGIINTLALSVIERTRELGLLRAVGLNRWQTARMIGVESVLIAVFGAVLGIVVGLCFAKALQVTLAEDGIESFAIPVPRLLGLVLAAAFAGIIAAALPAWRAARLNVLEAIAAE